MFARGYNLYIIGGYKYNKASNQMWLFHSIEREYVRLRDLELGRFSHTVHAKEEHAYIIGGCQSTKGNILKSCLYFNANNLKTEVFADLDKPRFRAGTVLTSLYVYVFGGVSNNVFSPDQIERCQLSGQTTFDVIKVEN